MKTGKIQERDLKALLGLGMLLLIVITYFLGFEVLLKSARVIKTENLQLEVRLADLRQKDADKANVQKETDEYNEKIDTIVQMFPSKVTTEKVFYDLYQLQTNLGRMKYRSGTLEMNGLFYPVVDNTAAAAQDTSTDNASTTTDTTGTTLETTGYSNGVITVYKSKITTEVKDLSYTALKTLVKEVQNYDGRLTLESMNLSFSNESGLLEGTIIFDFYALEGSPNEYKVPDISGISSGLKNIFGTFDTK